MNVKHRLELTASMLLHRVGRRAFDENGAMTTEMMILTAALSIAAALALVLLRSKITEAANNIQTSP